MKYFLLAWLLIIPVISYGQQIHDLKELRKYTYFIFHVKNNLPTIGGSGFFVQRNRQLYLVSAYHVVTLWHVYSDNREPLDDTLEVKLYNRRTGKVFYYPINIKPLIRNSENQYSYDKPDIYFIKISNSILNDYKIYRIDDINNRYSNDLGEVKNVVSYNFSNLGKVKNPSDFFNLTPELTQGDLMYPLSEPIHYGITHKTDSINYLIKITSGQLDLQGGSGAPAFFNYFNKITNKTTYIFGGCVSGGDLKGQSCVIVRPQFILNK